MKKIVGVLVFVFFVTIIFTSFHKIKSFAGSENLTEKTITQNRWSFSAHPFMGEGYESRPVVVSSVRTEARTLTVTTVRVRNISSKPVSALKLGWYLINEKDSKLILQQGETQLIPIEKSLGIGETEFLKLPVVSFTEISKPLLQANKLEGKYRVSIYVKYILFDDQSTWKEGQKVEAQKQNFDASIIKAAFSKGSSTLRVMPLKKAVICPKQTCDYEAGPPPGYICASSQNDEYCTNCITSCCNTICNDPSPSCGPCN